jgi:hypothetical protein
MTLFRLIIREAFFAVSAAVVVLFVMEAVWPNLVLAYLNLNLILIFWLIIGIVRIITVETKEKK